MSRRGRFRCAARGVVVAWLAAASGLGQLRTGGQASASLAVSGGGSSQDVYNNGRATFGARLDLFGGALVSENVSMTGAARITQDQAVHLVQLSIRFAGMPAAETAVEAGLLSVPFGNSAGRRTPAQNSFFRLPLPYEHMTTLSAPGYRAFDSPAMIAHAAGGLHLLDEELYDLGVMVTGDFVAAGFAAALINGMLGMSSTYAEGGLNPHRGFGKVVRVFVTPVPQLTAGASFASGPVLADPAPVPARKDPADYLQIAGGGDISVTLDHLLLAAEVMRNVFRNPQGEDRTAWAASGEARATISPRITVAGRAGRLWFNKPKGVRLLFGNSIIVDTWDLDQLRIEASASYRLERGALVKIVYEWNDIGGAGGEPDVQSAAAQVVVSF